MSGVQRPPSPILVPRNTNSISSLIHVAPSCALLTAPSENLPSPTCRRGSDTCNLSVPRPAPLGPADCSTYHEISVST